MFSRSTGQLSWLGFQTFCSVPFLYELRQILDWSCTPTTLNLFDWLKLEVSITSPLQTEGCHHGYAYRVRHALVRSSCSATQCIIAWVMSTARAVTHVRSLPCGETSR